MIRPRMAGDDAITVSRLTKRYGDHVAVDAVTFEVRNGESFGILGPNGAGKTTTLEMIEGLRKPDGGEVTVLGRPVWPDPRDIQSSIGVQLQSTALFDKLSARELLELFAQFYGRSDGPERAMQSLGLVGLEAKADAQAEELCDRVAIMDQAKVIALDTPAGLIASLGADVRISYAEAGEEKVVYAHDAQAAVLELLQRANTEGTEIDDLSVRGPSLEDVFLNLTGRAFRE